MKIKRSLFTQLFNIIFLACLFCIQSCAPKAEILSKQTFMLDTNIRIQLYNGGSEEVFEQIFSRIHEIEAKMSSHIDSSEISEVNRNSGIKAVKVSDDTFEVVQRALNISQLSDGAFDPSIGPLVSLWAIGTESPHLPTQEEIDNLMPLVNYHNVELNPSEKSIFLTQKNMALDLGGIAKGYAADETARICREAGVKSAVLDLGGNIFLLGEKILPGEKPTLWNVGIQNPSEVRDTVLGSLKAQDLTLVSSGDYERYFIKDDVRYHHILDPKTGFPARSGVRQVSIISSESSETCDGLSTTLFILGIEKGLKLIDSIPGYEALFVDNNNHLYPSANFPLSNFSILDSTYSLISE